MARPATQLRLAQDAQADALLNTNAFALLVGMLLDQQVPMERAFAAPATIAHRLGGHLDPATVAAAEPEALAALFGTPPAVHRFPAAMARRTQALARHLVEHYGGNAAALWEQADSGASLVRRLTELPGFGQQKARIFTALLGKQCGVRPPRWRAAAGSYGDDGIFRSVADVVDDASLTRVRAYKREQKAALRR